MCLSGNSISCPPAYLLHRVLSEATTIFRGREPQRMIGTDRGGVSSIEYEVGSTPMLGWKEDLIVDPVAASAKAAGVATPRAAQKMDLGSFLCRRSSQVFLCFPTELMVCVVGVGLPPRSVVWVREQDFSETTTKVSTKSFRPRGTTNISTEIGSNPPNTTRCAEPAARRSTYTNTRLPEFTAGPPKLSKYGRKPIP